MTEAEIRKAVAGKSVFIAVPSIDGQIEMSTASSIYSAMGLLTSYGVKTQYYQAKYDSLVTRIRGACAMAFLNSGLTHMMFVDADIDFQPDAILRLLLQDKDVIGASYAIKEINWKRVVRAVKAGVKEEALHKYATRSVLSMPSLTGSVNVKLNEPLAVDRLGTGFMLIKRHVFDRQIAELPLKLMKTGRNGDKRDYYDFFGLSFDNTDLLLSEDYHFCDMTRKLGMGVYVLPGIELGHTGKYRYHGSFINQLGVFEPEDLDPTTFDNPLMHPSEMEQIKRLARGKLKLAEIGVARGATSAVLLLSAAPEATAYFIDPFDPTFDMEGHTPNLEEAQARIESAKQPSQKAYICPKISSEAAEILKDENNFDFIFIDANHDAPHPSNDWAIWSPKCAVGAILCFHDAQNKFPAVLEAVKTAKADPKWEFVSQTRSLAVFRKISA